MEKKLTLNEIGLKYNSDKSSSYHCYLEEYDNFFSKYRNKNISFLEIGILDGDSINIFNEFFEDANIVAIDIDDKSHLKKNNINIIQGDQSDRDFLDKFNNEYFDIIIDDGSHKMSHQQISIGVLFKKLKRGGIYIIEDLHTSFDGYIENIKYGNNLFELSDGNRTIDFLNGIKNKNISNIYLQEEEYRYLSENIEYINIIESSRKSENEFSITSIIIKK